MLHINKIRESIYKHLITFHISCNHLVSSVGVALQTIIACWTARPSRLHKEALYDQPDSLSVLLNIRVVLGNPALRSGTFRYGHSYRV
jgi:hypothetical protein